ncbi:MAG: energy-coupled thiamine transporter ThiT [Clostridia bacterium]|nr:energy-coupled thiamine transporter ThiT [Clostridia bacterium]
MKNKKTFTKKLCVTAILIALGSVLSLIKVYEMPLGGSVTLLSMLPIVMIPLMYGTSWGLVGAFMYSAVQLMFGIFIDGLLGWGLSLGYVIGAIIFDYLLAFTVLGFAGVFKNLGVKGIVLGIVLAMVLRFLSHLVSGGIFFASWTDWDNVWLYSICYNGAYMLPEMVITSLSAVLVFKNPQIKRLYN